MKTIISINKKLFDEAENFSRIAGLSRNKLYSNAISEYIQNYNPDIVTEKLNHYYKNNVSTIDNDLKESTYKLFDREDW